MGVTRHRCSMKVRINMLRVGEGRQMQYHHMGYGRESHGIEMYKYMIDIMNHDECGVFGVPVRGELYAANSYQTCFPDSRSPMGEIDSVQPGLAKHAVAIDDIGIFLAKNVFAIEPPNNGVDPSLIHARGDRYCMRLPQERYLLIDCYACRCDQRVEQLHDMINQPISVTQYMADDESKMDGVYMTQCDTVPSGYPDIDVVRMMFTIPYTW